ncbi:MAG: hypothetical protein JW733_04175 [Coriobacteriia bacterium]|nr:hypothetical protein [Coriobacteriia bacterium]
MWSVSGGMMGRFAAASAALLSLVVIAGCAGGWAGGRRIEGPVLAVVSYSPDEIVLVDAGSLGVIERLRLRSMGTDPIAVPGLRTFVTAQCGGLGEDADNAIALVDLEQGGRVRYVELSDPNPGFVGSVGDGTVLVSHGVWSPEGIPVTRVDLLHEAVAGRATVANAYGALVVTAGSLWTSGPEGHDIGEQAHTIRRTSPDLATSRVFPAGSEPPLLAADGDSTSTILAVSSSGGRAVVRRVSAEDLDLVTSGVLDGLSEGVGQVVSVGDMLVLRDSSGAEMSRPGGPLIVLDRATLTELRRIDTGGSVASIAALGEAVYAVTWDTGELIEVDPGAGSVLRRVHLEGLDGKMLQLAGMRGSGPPSGP